MSLRDNYAYAIQTAKGKFDGSAQEKDGKLHLVGSVKTEERKTKYGPQSSDSRVAGRYRDRHQGHRRAGDVGRCGRVSKNIHGEGRRYMSGIAKSELGNASAYTKIFEANEDQLSDPDKIKPGQVLKLP